LFFDQFQTSFLRHEKRWRRAFDLWDSISRKLEAIRIGKNTLNERVVERYAVAIGFQASCTIRAILDVLDCPDKVRFRLVIERLENVPPPSNDHNIKPPVVVPAYNTFNFGSTPDKMQITFIEQIDAERQSRRQAFSN